MSIIWEDKSLGENRIFYRNYKKDNETKTFIIMKDKNNNFTLFISAKNILKQLKNDIYSVNLSKLKCIPLNIAKENDFIRNFLGEEFDSFIGYITKIQLSNDDLDKIIKELDETDLDNIFETSKEHIVVDKETTKVVVSNNKKSLISTIVDKFKNRFSNKSRKTLFSK